MPIEIKFLLTVAMCVICGAGVFISVSAAIRKTDKFTKPKLFTGLGLVFLAVQLAYGHLTAVGS